MIRRQFCLCHFVVGYLAVIIISIVDAGDMNNDECVYALNVTAIFLNSPISNMFGTCVIYTFNLCHFDYVLFFPVVCSSSTTSASFHLFPAFLCISHSLSSSLSLPFPYLPRPSPHSRSLNLNLSHILHSPKKKPSSSPTHPKPSTHSICFSQCLRFILLISSSCDIAFAKHFVCTFLKARFCISF